MNYYALYELNEESMRNVCNYFACQERGTATEINTNGSFMGALVRRGLASVVGKKEGDFYPVGDGLYRKSVANIYALNVSITDLWAHYVSQMHRHGENRKIEAEMMIEGAQRKLEEAKNLLSRF